MERFNPNEYKDLGKKRNGSTINNFFVPVLIVACSCLAMIGVAFSTKLVEEDTNFYKVRVDIINGEKEFYEKTVAEGAFRDVIESNSSFGSINCTKGDLSYDPLTSAISHVYVNQNISCVLVFQDDGTKSIDVSGLTPISDNSGSAYYFKADAANNYIKLEDELFRIIRVNGDGTLRVMLNDVVLSSSYGAENYLDSELYKTLNNWYDYNFKDVSYVVEGDFDTSNYENGYDLDSLIDFDTYYVGYVGALSVREAVLMSEGVSGGNFLETVHGIQLLNPSGYDSSYYFKDGKALVGSYGYYRSVRPVINIKADKLLGDGTFENPYTIG